MRQIAGLTITDNSFDHAPVSNFDLTFNVDEHPDRLDLSLVYNPDLFARATIEQMLDAYETLLVGAIADADVRVLELPILTAHERSSCRPGTTRQRPFPGDQCIHELFVEQARRTPAALPSSAKASG